MPRNDVRVVLELGEQHGIALVEVGPSPRLGHQVETLGRVLGEDDLIGASGTDEPGHLGPGRFHRIRPGR